MERPSFHAFSLFSRLKGRRVDSNNDQDWLSSVAYATEKKLYLLVAGFVPTPYMRLRAQFESLVIDQPQILNVLKPIKQDTLFKFYENGKIPTGVNDDQAESFLQTSRQAMVGFNHARLQWRDGLDVGISVAGKKINACEVKRYRLDKKNTVEATKVDAAHEQLQKIAKDSLARAVSDLAKKGIAQSYIDSFIRDMGSLFALRENSEPIDMTVRGELVAARDSVYRDYSKALAVAKNRTHSDQVSVETFSLDDGPIKFKMAPYTVELFEFCLK
ncbi:MAG TPA: hypothetical protein ENK06_10945 [Gammaproteobacteria bacterium]|nr:hypothetical protein [Gammaproteobacteria bacterium]